MGDIPTVNPLESGLVRIKREETTSATSSEKKAAINSSGFVEITIYPKTTAAELKAQLALLGIKNIGRELEKIAGKNRNATLEANELRPLDARLESLLSKSAGYFFLAARKNPRIIAKADRSIEPEINKWAYNQLRGRFGVRFGKIREIVLAAVKHYAWALAYADSIFWRDKEIVLAAVRNGRSIENIYGPLKKDKEVNLAALARDPSEFSKIHNSLRKKKAFMLDAIKRNAQVLYRVVVNFLAQKGPGNLGNLMQRYEDWFKNNIPFLKKAFRLNPAVIGYIPLRLRSLFINRYSKIIKALKIKKPQRMKNIEILKEIIANRKNLNGTDRRPLAVLIYAERDWNGSFEHNQMEELIKRGYRVVYFDVKTEKEAYRSLLLATKKKKADLLIFAGHGTQTHLALGAGDPSKNKIMNEDKYIDLSDKNEMLKMGLAHRLSKNAVIILESCSTGKGMGKEKNVANLMGKVFPQATVFSPTEDTRAERFLYNKENRVIGVAYAGGVGVTYAIRR